MVVFGRHVNSRTTDFMEKNGLSEWTKKNRILNVHKEIGIKKIWSE